MLKDIYRQELDLALSFAAEHTDAEGRMVVNGEIDTKDSGWLVLGGVIRGLGEGWDLKGKDLRQLCRIWTLASVRVDDQKSAWTTFALLYALDLSKGEFLNFFSDSEKEEFRKFICQIDMSFLLAASRNYRVAAAFIDNLRLRYGFIDKPSINPEECIDYMLAGYLGNGFFNDDDGRGDSRDKRIDAYSAEIIGLLLHYDEICGWNSFRHNEIMQILKDYCEYTLSMIDVDGEFAKWGRSLRGEAEVKKIFLWEYAQANNISDYGDAAAGKLFAFFLETGIMLDGKIGRDKAYDKGIWDEYTTHVQSQGYGIYGLAMAYRFASGDYPVKPILAEKESYCTLLEGPQILFANDKKTGLHYVLPAGNRLTKNMFFWHNRITGENDVDVDVSAKFMPLPYFGHKIPAPYAGPTIPFLPMLVQKNGERLVPRNLNPEYELSPDGTFEAEFAYCRPAEYTKAAEVTLNIKLVCTANGIDFDFAFSGKWDEGTFARVYLFECVDSNIKVTYNFSGADFKWGKAEAEPSIYAPVSKAQTVEFEQVNKISYKMRWFHG